jgi:hypothetical protein
MAGFLGKCSSFSYPIEPYPLGYVFVQPGDPLPVFVSELLECLLPIAVISSAHLDYRLTIRVMIDEISFSLGPRLLGSPWGSYCWLRSRLGGRSWALGGWSQFRLPAEPFPFLMWAKHRPPPTVTVSQIGPPPTVTPLDDASNSQVLLGIGTAMANSLSVPATVRVFDSPTDWAGVLGGGIDELGRTC